MKFALRWVLEAWARYYPARDTSLKRDVAIKVLRASYSLDHVRLSRFQLEAEAAAALNHPTS